MKILHLIYDHIRNPWVGGGAAIRAYEIYRRLSEKHDITIVCGKYPGAKNYSEGNLKFDFLGTDKRNYVFSTFSYALQARRSLKENRDRYDILIEDFAPYNPVFSFLLQKDAIIQLHQKEGWHHIRKYFILGVPFLIIESIYPAFFKNFIVVSEVTKKKFNVSGKIAIVSNGFDSKLLSMEILEEDFALYLGRLNIYQKGLDILMNALKYIKVPLVIVGGGKDKTKVRKIFEEYTRKGIIEMLGFIQQEKKIDFLRKCKLVVTPSRYEGQALVCLEAAACGKPVVVSDIPEMRYAVEAGFGISFKSGNAKDLGEKISFLLNNESLRKEMGQKARKFAKNLTWDRIAEEYERYLIQVFNRRDPIINKAS